MTEMQNIFSKIAEKQRGHCVKNKKKQEEQNKARKNFPKKEKGRQLDTNVFKKLSETQANKRRLAKEKTETIEQHVFEK